MWLNGYLDVVKWLHENRTEGCTTFAVVHAVVYGHLETVKWLLQNKNWFTKYIQQPNKKLI